MRQKLAWAFRVFDRRSFPVSVRKRPNSSAMACHVRLKKSAPTGLCPKAQGCRNAATLGNRSTNRPTATRLRLIRSRSRGWPWPQRRWRCFYFRTCTQGRRCTPTLGWGTQSRWDWPECGPMTLPARAVGPLARPNSGHVPTGQAAPFGSQASLIPRGRLPRGTGRLPVRV